MGWLMVTSPTHAPSLPHRFHFPVYSFRAYWTLSLSVMRKLPSQACTSFLYVCACPVRAASFPANQDLDCSVVIDFVLDASERLTPGRPGREQSLDSSCRPASVTSLQGRWCWATGAPGLPIKHSLCHQITIVLF